MFPSKCSCLLVHLLACRSACLPMTMHELQTDELYYLHPESSRVASSRVGLMQVQWRGVELSRLCELATVAVPHHRKAIVTLKCNSYRCSVGGSSSVEKWVGLHDATHRSVVTSFKWKPTSTSKPAKHPHEGNWAPLYGVLQILKDSPLSPRS